MDETNKQVTVLDLRRALAEELRPRKLPAAIVAGSFAHKFLPEGMSVRDFQGLVPIGFSEEALEYFKLGDGYSANDVFWGEPNGNPHLPNVYTNIFDNTGKRVMGMAAGKRREIEGI